MQRLVLIALVLAIATSLSVAEERSDLKAERELGDSNCCCPSGGYSDDAKRSTPFCKYRMLGDEWNGGYNKKNEKSKSGDSCEEWIWKYCKTDVPTPAPTKVIVKSRTPRPTPPPETFFPTFLTRQSTSTSDSGDSSSSSSSSKKKSSHKKKSHSHKKHPTHKSKKGKKSSTGSGGRSSDGNKYYYYPTFVPVVPTPQPTFGTVEDTFVTAKSQSQDSSQDSASKDSNRKNYRQKNRKKNRNYSNSRFSLVENAESVSWTFVFGVIGVGALCVAAAVMVGRHMRAVDDTPDEMSSTNRGNMSTPLGRIRNRLNGRSEVELPTRSDTEEGSGDTAYIRAIE